MATTISHMSNFENSGDLVNRARDFVRDVNNLSVSSPFPGNKYGSVLPGVITGPEASIDQVVTVLQEYSGLVAQMAAEIEGLKAELSQR